MLSDILDSDPAVGDPVGVGAGFGWGCTPHPVSLRPTPPPCRAWTGLGDGVSGGGAQALAAPVMMATASVMVWLFGVIVAAHLPSR